jgi:Kef-type K+ transport system membrane component KefB
MRGHAAIGAWALAAVVASTAAAAGDASNHTAITPLLFAVGGLLLAAKVGGIVAERIAMPAVVGELLAGVILAALLPDLIGERGVAVLRASPVLQVFAEVGVLILLFDVGLEADLRALMSVGPAAVIVALVGMAAPLVLGWGAAAWLLPDQSTIAHVFIGATLAATSIGITVRVLQELGASGRVEAQIILAAALVDDILGLVLLAVLSGIADGSGDGAGPWEVGSILLRAFVFLALTVGGGVLLSNRIVSLVTWADQPGLIVAVGLALCFALAFVAEAIGLAGIVGAFAAGLMLDPFGRGVRARGDELTLRDLMGPLAVVFVPLFFVLMGLKVEITSFAEPRTLGMGVALVVAAFAGKLACGVLVRRPGINRLAIGFGMLPRGEVGLIYAGIGASLTLAGEPLISGATFSAIVFMVLVTSVAAPVGLRWSLARAATPRSAV